MTLDELARQLNCQLEGEGNLSVERVAPLEDAGPGDVSFVADPRYAAQAAETRAGALLVGMDFRGSNRPLLRSANPAVACARAIALLMPAEVGAPGIHPTAMIDPSARLGMRASIGAYAVVGPRCRLGDDARLHPHAVLYADVTVGRNFLAHAHAVVREGTRIGDNVILQPGVVIGGDGFGFARRADGSYEKIPQVGRVEIGDDVEIQANSCIDRATLGVTRIGAGTKIDNLTQVAHNCTLGASVTLCAQVGIAGSTIIENGAVLAGQVGVAGHCRIGAGTTITAQSGTHGDLPAGTVYSGTPAFEHRQWLRSTAIFAKLGELYKSLQELRAAVRQLQENRRG